MSRRPPEQGWLAHYRELILGWRRKPARADGEDATQDAALSLLEQSVAAIHNPRAYLARSTANRLIDGHRRRRRVEFLPLDELPEASHPTAGNVEGTVYTQQVLQRLLDALAELPPACRQVYIRHRLEGWTHAEIAQDLGISRSMVEKHMQRALLHLDTALQPLEST